MGLPTPEELKKRTTVSYGLIAFVFGAGVWLGALGIGLLGLDGKIVDEVGGARKDFEKGDRDIIIMIEATNKRIDRKIHNHELIYHKDK